VVVGRRPRVEAAAEVSIEEEEFTDVEEVVLATGPDRHLGSLSGFKPNCCPTGGPGCQYTRTVASGTVRWYTPNPSELGWLSARRPVGPAIDSYKALVFAVCE